MRRSLVIRVAHDEKKPVPPIIFEINEEGRKALDEALEALDQAMMYGSCVFRHKVDDDVTIGLNSMHIIGYEIRRIS